MKRLILGPNKKSSITGTTNGNLKACIKRNIFFKFLKFIIKTKTVRTLVLSSRQRRKNKPRKESCYKHSERKGRILFFVPVVDLKRGQPGHNLRVSTSVCIRPCQPHNLCKVGVFISQFEHSYIPSSKTEPQQFLTTWDLFLVKRLRELVTSSWSTMQCSTITSRVEFFSRVTQRALKLRICSKRELSGSSLIIVLILKIVSPSSAGSETPQCLDKHIN